MRIRICSGEIRRSGQFLCIHEDSSIENEDSSMILQQKMKILLLKTDDFTDRRAYTALVAGKRALLGACNAPAGAISIDFY